jgi:hypothetical protein
MRFFTAVSTGDSTRRHSVRRALGGSPLFFFFFLGSGRGASSSSASSMSCACAGISLKRSMSRHQLWWLHTLKLPTCVHDPRHWLGHRGTARLLQNMHLQTAFLTS